MMKIVERARILAGRPYMVEVSVDETTDGQRIIFAVNPELPGCMAQGETIEAALKELQEARADFIASLLRRDIAVPEPAITATTTTGAMQTVIIPHTVQQTPSFSEQLARVAQKQTREPLFVGVARTLV